MLLHCKVIVAYLSAILVHHGEFFAEARTARNMTLDFFKTIVYTAVGTANDEGTVTETEWREHTESNWVRALDLEQTDGTQYPFIMCDDNTANEASIERRNEMARQAVGMQANEDPNDYFATIYNTPETTCVMCSLNASVAEALDFIVQPVSFLMKINIGSVEFTDADVDDGVLQYSVYFCPGIDDLGTAWALQALQTLVPRIPELVQVEEAAIYEGELLELKTILDNDPTFCDSLLIDNVESEEAGENDKEYVILTFSLEDGSTSAQQRSSTTIPYTHAKTCFHLLTFALAFDPKVCYMERRIKFETSNQVAAWIHQSGVPGERPFYDAGIKGEGQVVAVSDTGLDLQSCYFRDTWDSKPMEYKTVDPTRRKVVQYYDYVNHGEVKNGHGSHVAGTVCGRKSEDGVHEQDGFVDGVAKDAKLAFFDIGKDDENEGLLIPGANTLLNPGKGAGAKIHSASWGSRSDYYTNMDRDFDRYLHNDESMMLVVAAGNEGPDSRTVRSPAHAKNVLTVGATNSAENDINRGTVPVDELAGFSSIGPSMDQRIKPDIVASGAHILSVGSRDEPACDPPLFDQLPIPGKSSASKYGILSLQGTSMATPVVSGHAALVRQYFLEGYHGNGTRGSAESMDISGTLLKAVLINGAQPLAGNGINTVDARQGFGRLSLLDSLPLKRQNDLNAGFLDKETLVQGDSNVYNFTLTSNKTCGDAELSVTMVWADPPGYVGCMHCVLNDLDIKVLQMTPNGTQTITKIHYPNGRNDKDTLNNVERVRFKASVNDSFVVTVTADHLEGPIQTYSLAVVYGCLNHRDRRGCTNSGAAVPATKGWGFVGAMVTMAVTTLVAML